MTTTNKVKKQTGHDILPKIFCLLAAFILWLYVTQVETSDYEETFNGVTVELVNTSVLESEAGLHVYSGHGNTVNVTVSGKKSDINRYTSENIRVYADVTGITESGKHTLPITAESPTGISVSGMSVSFITVYVDVTSTIEVDVKPKISNAVIGEGCELGELIPEFSLITVTGPKTVLNDIDYAQTSLNLGNVNSSTSTIAPLELVSRSGEEIDMRYVQMNRDEVKVSVPVYITKKVPLSVSYKHGFYNDNNVKITFSPAEIQLKGDPLQLENIDTLNLGTIDEKSITSDVKQVYKLNLPDGIISTENVESVNVSIAHVGTTVRAFSVSDITLMGADKLKCEVLTKSLTVRVRGPKNVLDSLKKDDITANINLSEFSESVSGTVTINAVINISGNSSNIYSVGEYPVQIKIG